MINKTQDIRPKTYEKSGFSLTEVLLSLGILAVGMLFIAGVFPASINLTTIASERTIAASVADEAFAKIKLYGLNPAALSFTNQAPIEAILAIPYFEYAYPSTSVLDPNMTKRYWWTALCRKTSSDPLDRDVQVTVFVCRKAGINSNPVYRQRASFVDPTLTNVYKPVPVYMSVIRPLVGNKSDELQIVDFFPVDPLDERAFINDGYTIVEETSGNIYRVLERYAANQDLIRLDKDFPGNPSRVWVIPPPVISNIASGRSPCIAVYQKIIRF